MYSEIPLLNLHAQTISDLKPTMRQITIKFIVTSTIYSWYHKVHFGELLRTINTIIGTL